MEISVTCSRPKTGDLSDFIHEMHVPVANGMAIWMALLLLAMGLEHSPHPEGATELEQSLVLVGRVDEHGLTGAPAAHDEHVVVVRADDDLVHLHVGVRPLEGGRRR